MRSGSKSLFVFLAAAMAGAAAPPARTPSPSPSPSPSVTPSPSPTPRYKLIPYAFESAQQRSTVRLLRFEDKAEVRALEMNAAIARFFDKGDEKSDMLRGATPGGAPTLAEMGPYRPHVSPSLDLLNLAFLAVEELRKQIRNHERNEGEELLRTLLLATPSPTPSPSPKPTPSPRLDPPGDSSS